MKIVVNHLTRMKPGYICVAGIDQASGKHVRPVLPGSRLTTAFLKREGGPVEIAAVVDLGPVHASGSPPEMEDHTFNLRNAKATAALAPRAYWSLLQEASEQSLAGIFGRDLKPNGNGMAVDVGEGHASLGCLLPMSRPGLEIAYGKVKVHLREGTRNLILGVTDLRLYEKDQTTPRNKIIQDLDHRIRRGTGVILSVGLARPWLKPGDTEERHFLQVNNLHLEDDPTWSGD